MMIPDSEKEGLAQEIKYPPMVFIIYHRGGICQVPSASISKAAYFHENGKYCVLKGW